MSRTQEQPLVEVTDYQAKVIQPSVPSVRVLTYSN